MRTLRELVDADQMLRAETRAYWEASIQPLLNVCSTREELNKVMGEVSLACVDNQGQIREMPHDYSVRFIFAASALRGKA